MQQETEERIVATGSASGDCGALARYLRELRRIPQLSIEEESACARLAAQGDEQARQRLIQANLRFVVHVARRYRNRGVPLEDLVSEGNVGLIRAAARFDPDRGIRFISYAVWWIRQAILRAVHEDCRLIRVPRGRAGALPHLGVSAPVALATVSLDNPIGFSEDAEPFGACLGDEKAVMPEEAMAGVAVCEQVGSLLAGLPDREASILQDRFGLAGRPRISLLEAGRKHGLSKERIRQIEKRALRRIRASDCAPLLQAYAN